MPRRLDRRPAAEETSRLGRRRTRHRASCQTKRCRPAHEATARRSEARTFPVPPIPIRKACLGIGAGSPEVVKAPWSDFAYYLNVNIEHAKGTSVNIAFTVDLKSA